MNGFALITVLLLSSLLLLLSGSFIVIVVSDLKITQSQIKGVEAYYLAEGGVNQAIWEIKNNAIWKNDFISGNLNQNLETDEFLVNIQSTAPGKAEIFSTGKKENARRVVRVKLTKALANTFPEDIAIYSGGLEKDLEFWVSRLLITESGDIYSGDDIELYNSTVSTPGKARAVNNIFVDPFSALYVNEIIENDAEISFPMLDFANYKNQAQVYSQDEFKNILKNNPSAEFSGIIYVEGDVDLKNDQHPVINGLLLADKKINLGAGYGNPAGITINNIPGQASGLISKETISFGNWTRTIDIEGLVYSLQKIVFANFDSGTSFNLKGGMISPEIDFFSTYKTYNIIHDPQIIQNTLG